MTISRAERALLGAVQNQAVVLRAGIVTPDSIRAGAERVDTTDHVYNLSVQVSAGTAKQDDKTIALLLASVPNTHYALTFAVNITNKGGTIVRDPIPGNALHGLVSGITVDDLYAILKINKH